MAKKQLGAAPSNILDATTKTYVDTADNLRVLKAGDTMSGALQTTVGGQAGVGTNPFTTPNYVQSRLQNLITNGNGLLNNNYNFSSFTFDTVETHGGGGSFSATTLQVAYLSDELIPVDPEKYYRLVGWGKSGDTGGANYNAGNAQYLGISPYDIDGITISPHNYSKVPGSTDTTLAADLNPNDTTMTLTNSTGWSTAAAVHTRQMTWWPYTNAKGYTYPNYTYTRNATLVMSGYNTNGLWATTGISGNVITLTAPWSGATLPAGTPVRNSSSGGSFKYIAAAAAAVPNAWTRYEGYIGTIDTAGAQTVNQFPYGTAYLRLLFLVNYPPNSTGNKIRWSDLWFSEMSTKNLEFSHATPTAHVHIKAGTATAGTAPFKLTDGVVTTVAETGALEMASGVLYFTPTGTTRRRIDYLPTSPPDYTVTNPSTLRSINVTSITHDDLARVVGTILEDLIAQGRFQ